MLFRHRVPPRRRLSVESLEARQLLSATPYGALPHDTAEYLLGRVAVTPVFLESDGSIDPSTADWTASQIDSTLGKIDEALDWWVETLERLDTVHELEFVVDSTFARQPFESPYEGIERKSDDYALYVGDFLSDQGFDRGNFAARARDFNHAQRLKHDTDWAFSLFVVNSAFDEDGAFAGGTFSRAFAFAGGLFYVVPSERPASTYAHELGHIFYARDEYTGGGDWTDRRGYYRTQNLNAVNNPTPGFQQQPSIMSAGVSLADAYRDHVSPPSTLAMIGWQDSDGDGIFDVMDNPVLLDGAGRFDEAAGLFRFEGTAAVTTLPNLNPVGHQSDITLSTISAIEYQVDGGNWFPIAQPNAPVADLSLEIGLPPSFTQLQLRAVDQHTGLQSAPIVFERFAPARATQRGLVGTVQWERDGAVTWGAGDHVGEAFEIQILGSDGSELDIRKVVEPDAMSEKDVQDQSLSGVRLRSVGARASGGIAALPSEQTTSTGTKSFWGHDTFTPEWTEEWGDADGIQLKASFDMPTSVATIDVIGASRDSVGRLSAYRADGSLIGRATSGLLAKGEIETLVVHSPETDIAYIIAGGHGGETVLLDQLTYGSELSVTTDHHGTFAFPHLPAGDYRAVAAPWDDAFEAVTPAELAFTVDVDGTTTADFVFAATRSPWQNSQNPLDVSSDGSVAPVDALQIINEINRAGPRALTAADSGSVRYDVDGDFHIAPIDALQIINGLNRLSALGEPTNAAVVLVPPPASLSAESEPEEKDRSTEELAAKTPQANDGQTQKFANGVQVGSSESIVAIIPEDAVENTDNSDDFDSRIAAIDRIFSEPFGA